MSTMSKVSKNNVHPFFYEFHLHHEIVKLKKYIKKYWNIFCIVLTFIITEENKNHNRSPKELSSHNFFQKIFPTCTRPNWLNLRKVFKLMFWTRSLIGQSELMVENSPLLSISYLSVQQLKNLFGFKLSLLAKATLRLVTFFMLVTVVWSF